MCVLQSVPSKKLPGPTPEVHDSNLNSDRLKMYLLGNSQEIWLTDAEKLVCERWQLQEYGKTNAYASVFVGGKDTIASAASFYRQGRRIEYCRYLLSKKAQTLTASIEAYSKRIASMVHVSPYDLVEPLTGMKKLYDLSEVTLASCKVKVVYDEDGNAKSTTVEPYTLIELMQVLTSLEEIDATLAQQFKANMSTPKPVLKRSYDKKETDNDQ